MSRLTPEGRASVSAAAAASWRDPEIRARREANMKDVGRAAAVASWRDPAIRARRVAGMKKARRRSSVCVCCTVLDADFDDV